MATVANKTAQLAPPLCPKLRSTDLHLQRFPLSLQPDIVLVGFLPTNHISYVDFWALNLAEELYYTLPFSQLLRVWKNKWDRISRNGRHQESHPQTLTGPVPALPTQSCGWTHSPDYAVPLHKPFNPPLRQVWLTSITRVKFWKSINNCLSVLHFLAADVPRTSPR